MLEEPEREMTGRQRMSGRPLIVLAHIEQQNVITPDECCSGTGLDFSIRLTHRVPAAARAFDVHHARLPSSSGVGPAGSVAALNAHEGLSAAENWVLTLNLSPRTTVMRHSSVIVVE